jgi:anti-sigma factor RsiW
VTTPPDTSRSAPDPALLVHAYLDGELDLANALGVERQVAADAALAAELASARALRQVLRERYPPEPVPPRLQSRIDVAVGAGRRRERPSWEALAASVVLAMALSGGSTWLALRAPASDRVLAEMVDGHMRALIAQRPADVDSSDRHTVKPWFNSRIAQSPRVVDLAAEGFPLVGARVDVVGTKPVPTLVYGRRLHVISVSATPAGPATRDPALLGAINGYNVLRWSSEGTTYWAVSDLNADELETFARLFLKAPPA